MYTSRQCMASWSCPMHALTATADGSWTVHFCSAHPASRVAARWPPGRCQLSWLLPGAGGGAGSEPATAGWCGGHR
ncbi:hypothetical protein HaLaN_29594 [Haematococcus lacustris]|uniref:Uncharacterized protein n=1 Tax=Haematococcus lacustris TaxID=44745 RepID=A0A6A0ADA9_HAELA|nr:hypothetical protein HaLaN_29594 [Haematococcus lacustris]